MSNIVWPISFTDLILAIKNAEIRMLESDKLGLNHSTTYNRTLEERLTEETVGILGELAVFNFLGKGKLMINTFHNIADAGKDVECRATYKENGSLIVRDNDDDNRRYILATVNRNEVTLKGWLYGKEAKKPMFERNPNNYRPAWFVPQEYLNSMDSFELK
jgi:hypothetical protein